MRVTQYATENVVSVAPGDSLDKAISLMEEFSIHHLPVVDDGRVVGMLADRDVLLSVAWKLSSERHAAAGDKDRVLGPRRVSEIMVQPVVTIGPADEARQAVQIMLERSIGALPVVVNDHLHGIVTETDLLKRTRDRCKASGEAADFFERDISSFMMARVATVDPTVRLLEIMDKFRELRARHLVVVSDGALLGIISDRDARRALGECMLSEMARQEEGQLLIATRRASDIMTTAVSKCQPNTPLTSVIDRMLDNTIHCLPVVEDDRLLGIVTHSDILRAIMAAELL